MKDKNGIEIKCENCELYNGKFCEVRETYPECNKGGYFNPTIDAYKVRIKELQDELYADKYNYESWEEIKEEHQKLEATILELQKELNIVQESERSEAQEADRLREEVQNLKKENERLSKEIIDLGTGTLAEKNYQSAMRAAAALCVAAKKLNYDTSKLSVYDLIDVFLKEGKEQNER